MKEIKVATTKYGYTSATDMLKCHEEIMITVYFSRKGLAPTRQPKEKGKYDDGSDHALSSLSSVLHPKTSRPSAIDLMSCLSLLAQLCFLCCFASFMSSHALVTMSIQFFVQLTCATKKKSLSLSTSFVSKDRAIGSGISAVC